MRRVLLVAALAASAALHGSGAFAQTTPDALAWLQRIFTATQKLSYTGTFFYQHGDQVETSRLTRIVDATGVHERLETLDGAPREIIRFNEEVKCYLPASMTVKIDRQMDTSPFPGMRAEQVKDLADSYVIRKGEVERIAGYDCQAIILEPKDGMRYGHKLWADVGTGMLVRAKTFNEKQEVVEQFAFTQLRIGGRIDKREVESKLAGKGRDWKIEQHEMTPANLADQGWLLAALPPGFRKITEVKRTSGQGTNVGHIVVSDGLAAVSVFIEPLSARNASLQIGPSRQGAVSVYVRKLDQHLVTVVGEAPGESVRFIANAVEYRKPN